MQTNTEARQESAYRVVICRVAREPRQRMHDNCMNAPSLLAKRNQLEEFRPLDGLGRLATLDEDLGDLEPLPLAVFAAEALLRGQAQVLRLLARRDAAIDNGSHRSKCLVDPHR